MIRITKNQQWKQFERLFNKDILKRYEWFLWEFSHRLTLQVNDYLLGRLPDVIGDVEYKKRLAVAEIRDKKMKVWWAIAARAFDMSELEIDPGRTIFKVSTRMKIKNDPVADILQDYGPWTLDTIPWVPVLRQAAVVAKTVTAKEVNETYLDNRRNWKEISALLENYKIDTMPRQMVLSRLRAVTDLSVQAIRMEYGLEEGSSPHWRPAIKWARNEAPKVLKNDEDLFRSMTDPKFQKWKRKGHEKDHMTEAEVKALQEFQDKVRV